MEIVNQIIQFIIIRRYAWKWVRYTIIQSNESNHHKKVPQYGDIDIFIRCNSTRLVCNTKTVMKLTNAEVKQHLLLTFIYLYFFFRCKMSHIY